MSRRELDRRSLLRLAGAGLVGAVGCSGDPAPLPRATSSAPSTSPPPTSPPPPPPSPPPGLPAVGPWQPGPAEPLPRLKQVASAFVQGLATRPSGALPEDVLAGVMALTGEGFDATAALTEAASLYDAPVSTGEIVYPQFGGLVPDGPGAREASVMVVLRQRLLLPDGAVGEVVRTCDVRLRDQDGDWQVLSLASIGGQPVDRPADLDPVSITVLDDPRIELPDSARWDVHARRVSLETLSVLAEAAGRSPVSVTVLRSGHPVEVFGSGNLSDHTRGRAVDIWGVGGIPVVAQPPSGSPYRVVLDGAFADPRVTQTGSPGGTDLDGPGQRRSFTNTVHADHLHLAAIGTPAAG